MNSGNGLSRAALRRRSAREIADRALQAAQVTLERLGLDRREPSPDALFRRLDHAARERHGSLATWLDAFRARGGAGFFAGADDPAATAVSCRALDPEGCQRLVAQADGILAGRFDLLGLRAVPCGSPPDWHRDPVLGVRAPLRHWSRIPYLDPAVAGDHKRVWELNRHQWLVTLAQAWLLTGEARYVDGIGRAVRSWMDGNPPKLGINWASSLEVAFRAISWLWCLRLAGATGYLDDALLGRMVGHLVLAGRHIARNLSTWFSPNTHLTGEALALLYLGSELADFPEAARWRDTGRKVLLQQLPIHVRPDGTYFEQSTWYHRYTFDFYLHFHLLEQRAHGITHDGVVDALHRLASVMLWMARPDGSMPLVGDDDGGRLLFLDGRAPSDVRPALTAAAALTGDGTLLAAGSAAMEAAWLMGTEAAGRLGTRVSRHPDGSARHFADGGTVVVRSGWGPTASVMTLDAGPHGTASGGHSHADALTFDLCIDGRAVFVDPGTCDYVQAAVRDRFRHTAAHNGATFDGAPSAATRGPFTWSRRADARLDRFVPGPSATFLRGSHDGFEQSPAGATYERSVVFLADGIWLLRDSFRAGQAGVAEVHFQSAHGVAVDDTAPRRAVLRVGDTVVARLWAADADASLQVEPGSVSPAYGACLPSPRLRIAAPAGAAVDIHALIAAPGVALAEVSAVRAGDCSVVTLARPDVVDLVGFGPGGSEALGVEAAAECWWVRLARETLALQDWAAVACTHLRVGDRFLTGGPRGGDGSRGHGRDAGPG